MDLHDKIGPLSYQELCCRISLTQIIEQAHIVSYPYYVMLLLQVHTVLGVASTKLEKVKDWETTFAEVIVMVAALI